MMDFSEALHHLKAGAKLTRHSWPQVKFVFLVAGSDFTVNRKPLLGIYPEGTPIKYRPHLDLRTVDGSIGVWTATQPDILADDWLVV